MTDRPSLERAIAGGLLGVAAGDALGSTVEFMSAEEIKRWHGTHREMTGGGAFGWEPGQGTDDTALTKAVTAAYLDGEYRLSKVADEFLAWYYTGPPDIGGATRRALENLAEHGDPTASGLRSENSCGNGSLMRALPTALARTDPERRRRETAEISAVTHAHPKCVDSCIAYNEIAAALLDGASPAQAVAAARALDLHPAVRETLDLPADLPVTALRTGGYVVHSLGCAVWAIQQPPDFEERLVKLVNRGDDADTTGAIAGGLLGIIAGVDGIPGRWLAPLEYGAYFTQAARRLAQIRG